MTTLPNFPMVSQRTTLTSDGKPSEDALYECVPASIGAVMLWLDGKSAWDASINPDLLKDAAYGDSYTGGTDASRYIDVCKSMGFNLYNVATIDAAHALSTAREMLTQNKPAIFTMLDPYVDTSLPQYTDWTHVCVWFSDDAGGLTAMDPFIARAVYKSDATWANLLRSTQVWSLEKIPMSTVPQGWHDDNTTLTAPNGHKVVRGFRDFVLAHNWDASNQPLQDEQGLTPLEGSNPGLGGGTRQLFEWTMLEWTAERGVFAGWIGQELLWREGVYAQIYQAYSQAKAQLAQVHATPQLLADVHQATALLAKY